MNIWFNHSKQLKTSKEFRLKYIQNHELSKCQNNEISDKSKIQSVQDFKGSCEISKAQGERCGGCFQINQRVYIVLFTCQQDSIACDMVWCPVGM